MYIIIGGGGFIGRGITKELVAQRHDVVVIDSNHDSCEELYAKYGAVTIQGDATELETLESAGIDKCEIAIAAMSKDSDNLTFAMLAKHFEVPQIIVRMKDPKYEEVYKSTGVHNIARVTKLLIDQVMVNIGSPELRKVISFGEVEIYIYAIPETSQSAGKMIADVVSQEGFPNKCTITCIFDNSSDSFIIPRGDHVLNPKDRVFLCGVRDDILEAVRFLE